MNLNGFKIKDLPRFKGKITVDRCIINENTDFELQKNAVEVEFGNNYECTLEKGGILKSTNSRSRIKLGEGWLSNGRCGLDKYVYFSVIKGIEATEIADLPVLFLPMVKSAEKVWCPTLGPSSKKNAQDIDITMPKDVGIEELYIFTSRTKSGRIDRSGLRKVKNLEVCAKSLNLDLCLSSLDMKNVKSNCEELNLMDSNTVCAVISKAADKDPEGFVLRGIDEKNFPNLKRIYYSYKSMKVCIEKVPGSSKLWKKI